MGDLSILGVRDEDETPRVPHRRGPRRRRPWLGPLLTVMAVLALAVGGYVGGRAIWHQASAAPDYSGSGSGTVYIQVADGDAAGEIGQKLLDAGVIKSTRAFKSAAEGDARSRSLQPGTYALRRHMRASSALSLLLDPASVVGRVTVPEGMTDEETFAFLARHTTITVAQFRAADTSDLGLPGYAAGRLDGFLFPTTYDIPRDASAHDVLKMMVSAFTARITPATLVVKVPGVTLGPQQVLTVASLDEAEGITSDYGKISRVIYNRLAVHRPLQLDSTVNYALGRNSNTVTTAQTRVDSPYNTYLHAGLPPTPITNPGMAAIDAALHPVAGDWRFFVKSDKAGHSFFTDSPQAFAAQKRKSRAEGVY